jgi:hypothetical protein
MKAALQDVFFSPEPPADPGNANLEAAPAGGAEVWDENTVAEKFAQLLDAELIAAALEEGAASQGNGSPTAEIKETGQEESLAGMAEPQSIFNLMAPAIQPGILLLAEDLPIAPEALATLSERREGQDLAACMANLPEGWEALLADSEAANPTGLPAGETGTTVLESVPALSESAARIEPGAGLKIKKSEETGAENLELELFEPMPETNPSHLFKGGDTTSANDQSGEQPNLLPGDGPTNKQAEPQFARLGHSAAAGHTSIGQPANVHTAALPQAAPAVNSPGLSENLMAGVTPSQANTHILHGFTALEKLDIVKQFSAKLADELGSQQESLSIELHPPELGRVRVTVVQNGQQLHARLGLQDRALLELFNDQAGVIRRELEQAGIQLGEVSVALDHPQAEPGTGQGSAEERGLGDEEFGPRTASPRSRSVLSARRHEVGPRRVDVTI